MTRADLARYAVRLARAQQEEAEGIVCDCPRGEDGTCTYCLDRSRFDRSIDNAIAGWKERAR